MRRKTPIFLCLACMAALSACARDDGAEAARALASVNVIDESNLSDIMLTAADPAEAVDYFKRASAEKPDRIDLRRGLARSLVRAGRPTEAVGAWRAVTGMDAATNDDRVMLADALIRANDWAAAEAVLQAVPPTFETYDRYRLEAMIADSNADWDRADSFYQTAVGLTTRPAGVLNNWGYSRLTRGDPAGAEQLFAEALTHAPDLFTAKNNLTLARAAQRNYDLPVTQMTQTERAQLLHTMALAAIKQGDVAIGRGLLQEAVETHPRHFEAAARALEALPASLAN